MIRVLEGKNYNNTSDFVRDLNKARLQNKQKWIYYIGLVNGRRVEIKTFDCGDLQIVRVNGARANNREYDLSVGAWKSEIEKAINNA